VAGDTYPNPPQVMNYDAAQTITANGPFTLTWEPFLGGTATDYVRLEIEDNQGNSVLATGDPGDGSALPGTATAFTIPAGALQPGASYTGTLIFADTQVETNGYPGALGLSGYARSTSFALRTSGTASAPPRLTGATILQGSPPRLEFTVEGSAGRTHRVDASQNLQAWIPVSTNTPTGASFTFTADIAAAPSHSFYRVVLLP
jgi:hypothetical protein